ncbi:MAG: hypothetical protein ACLQM8_03805 [Limisphaerales bacterium]
MTDEEFGILAMKVLAGQATPDERAQLEAVSAQDSERRQELAELRAAWASLREFGAPLQALDAPSTPLPEHRLGELRGAVRARFSARPLEQPGAPRLFDLLGRWLRSRQALAGALAVVLLCGLFLALRLGREHAGGSRAGQTIAYLLRSQGQPEVRRAGRLLPAGTCTALRRGDEIRLKSGVSVQAITPAGAALIRGAQRLAAERLIASAKAHGADGGTSPEHARGAAALKSALFLPVNQLLAAGFLVNTRDAQGISLYAPREATRSLTPLILWKSEPGKTYDLTITDEFDKNTALWQLHGVVSPVDFGNVPAWKGRPLAKNGLYRITVRETGNPLAVCEYAFRTLKDANGPAVQAPAERIGRAYQLLTSVPPCPGDALAELLMLSPEFAQTELVLRLELVLFGQLQLQEDYQATAAKLTLMTDSRPRSSRP